jgi:hypothetical protein
VTMPTGCPTIVAELGCGVHHLHTVTSRQAVEERAVVENNPGQPARADGAAWTSAEAATGPAVLRHEPESAGDGVNLAAATAAVITARWGARAAPPERARSRAGAGRPENVHANGPVGNGHASDGHASDGYSSDGYSSHGHAGNGPASNGPASNGSSSHGHLANGHSSDGSSGSGHAGNGHASNGAAGIGHFSDGSSGGGHASNGPFSDGSSASGHAGNNGRASNGHSSNGYTSSAVASGSGNTGNSQAMNGQTTKGYDPPESGHGSYDARPAAKGASFLVPAETPAAPAMFPPEPFTPVASVPEPSPRELQASVHEPYVPPKRYAPGVYAPEPRAAAPERLASDQYPPERLASDQYPPERYLSQQFSHDRYAPEQYPHQRYAPDPHGAGESAQGQYVAVQPHAAEQHGHALQVDHSVRDPWGPAMPVSPAMTPAMPVSSAPPVTPAMPMNPDVPRSHVMPTAAAVRAASPVPEPTAAPVAPRRAEAFDSIIGDLAFPEPFVPEPYEPYDPYHPKPSTAESDLPQRVPGEPDVPDVQLAPNDPLRDPATVPVTESGDLDRIADFLQTLEPETPRRDGFDVAKVLEAVRGVPLVADAQLRFNAESGHTLRIEFVDGADEGQVTREVARLLRETMGLDAAPTQPLAPHQVTARAAASVPTGRAMVRAPGPTPAHGLGSTPAHGLGQAPGTGPGQSGAPVSLAQQSGRPLPAPIGAVPRVVLDHVQVTTLGLDATIEVQLTVSSGQRMARQSVGHGHGPAVDGYLLRLAGSAAGNAIDQLLTIDGTSRARCYIEHVAVVPFAGCEVAVVVMLLVEGQFVEQLSGAVLVAGDPRQAVVRATLSAVNRRLESLLA